MRKLSSLKLPYEALMYTQRELTAEAEKKLRSHIEMRSSSPVHSVCFSPTEPLVVSGSSDGVVRLWNTETHKLVDEFPGDEKVNIVCFSSNGAVIASGSADGTVRMWDAIARKHPDEVTGIGCPIRSICLSALCNLAASVFSDGSTRVWDIHMRKSIITLGTGYSVNSVCFSSDGVLVAAGSEDGSVCVWDTRTRKRIAKMYDRLVSSICFSGDGSLIATGSEDGTICLWNIQTEAPEVEMRNNDSPVDCLCFSPDDSLVASGSRQGSVCIWESRTGNPMSGIDTEGRVSSLSFSSNGNLLAVGLDNGAILLWNTPTYAMDIKTNSFATTIVKDVESYRKLLELVAQIAALNPQYQLFFRGQNNNWIDGELEKPGTRSPTLYSGVWRNPLSSKKLAVKCSKLNGKGNDLTNECERHYRDRAEERTFVERLKQNPLVRWALLQHYGICDTPLLDVTRNLQVACTFARMNAVSGHGYVYVLGLPYQREAISIDDNEGVTVMSLLGVMPPSARRPLNQDGYFVSTSEWWRYVADGKTGDAPRTSARPNYFRRVMTVFRIPTGDKFYEGSGFSDLKRDWICPPEKEDEFAHMLQTGGFGPRFW